MPRSDRFRLPIHRNVWIGVGLTAIVVYPLGLMFDNINQFEYDWYIHQWAVGYFGEYLKYHGAFPSIMTTPSYVGIPLPIFYGYLFYPVFGAIAAITDGNIGMRLGILLTWISQVALTYLAFSRAAKSRGVGLALSALISFAIYPLTNLYNRGAITEIVATALLADALCCWYLFLQANSHQSKVFYILFSGICLVFSAGSHPITALYGIPCALCIGLMSIPGYWQELRRAARRWELVVAGALVAVGGVLALLPWLMAVLHFGHRVRQMFSQMYLAPIEPWDWLAVRMSPFPFDPRTLAAGTIDVSAPYLDAQINFPLLMTVLGLMFWTIPRPGLAHLDKTRWAIGVSSLLAVCVVIASSVSTWRGFDFLQYAQFRYRLITYANLFLLAAAWSFIGIAGTGRGPFAARWRVVVFSASLTLAVVNVGIKLTHAMPIITVETVHLNYRAMPPIFDHPAGDYLVYHVRELPQTEWNTVQHMNLPIGDGLRMGEPLPLAVDSNKPTRIVTNVATFPWNRILLDGVPVPDSEMYSVYRWLGLVLPAGRHTLDYRFMPNPIWLRAREVSFWAFAALSLMTIAAGVWALQARSTTPE